MRIRSTKPEFWRSKTIARLDWGVRLVLKGLESYVDDNGVGKDDIALIAGDVFPRDLVARAPETLARLSEAISELHSAGLIARYEVDNEELLYIDRWKDLQRIDKPAKGRFRRPDGTLEYSEDVSRESYAKPREDVARAPEVLAPVTGEQGNRGTGEQAPPGGFAEFWKAYPKKVGKPAAEKAWKKAVKDGADPAHLALIAGQYAERTADTDSKFICHPTTWLNQARYNDEPEPETSPVSRRHVPLEVPADIDPDDYEAYAAWLREAAE